LVGFLASGGPSPVYRQALRPIQPLIKWELGALSSREKQAGNKPDRLLPRLKMHVAKSHFPICLYGVVFN